MLICLIRRESKENFVSQEAVDNRRSTLPRTYEPKQLNPLHHEILRRALLGDSHRDIATALDCTVATVSNAVNSGLGRDKLRTMTAVADINSVELAQQIRETAPKALAVIQEILDSDSANYATKFRAATDILDRAGHAAVKKVEVRRSATELSAEELDRLKQEAVDRLRATGMCVDAEYVVSDVPNIGITDLVVQNA